jgi:ubiquinol-cytochrome c reductase cytochrome b subunit
MFAVFVFYLPDALGHPDNFIPANPLVTPAHIVPEWYLLPFYAILRAIDFNVGPIDSKLGGFLLMVGALVMLFVLPWLDSSKVRSMRYRPLAKIFFFIFVICCFCLGWAGAQSPDLVVADLGFMKFTVTNFAQVNTLYYFAFFLVVLPVLGLVEKPGAVPDTIAKAVGGHGEAAAVAGQKGS